MRHRGPRGGLRSDPCVESFRVDEAARARRPDMLTLADAQHLGACTVYRDVTWRGGARALTPTFYVLDDAPQLATADDGGPDYTFFWYRGARPAESGGL